MILIFPPREHPNTVIAELAKHIPAIASAPPAKRVWNWETRIELPGKVSLTIQSTRTSGYTRSKERGVLEKLSIVYDSDYYNGYKSRDILRRAIQFKHNGEHSNYSATELKLDLAAVREKLSEVMTFAEQNETRLSQRRESLTAGENHAKKSAEHFRDLMIAEGLEAFTAAPSRICGKLEHDTRKDFDRPLRLELRLTDEQGIQVIRLLKQLEAEQT